MKRSGSFTVLFISGMLVYFVGGYWAAPGTGLRTAFKVGIPIILFGATILCHRKPSLLAWRRASLALFAGSCGFMVSWFLSAPLGSLLGVPANSVAGIAIDKAIEALLICITVLVVARGGGVTMGDLFLRKGRLKAWIPVGMITFGGFLTLFLLQAQEMGMSSEQLISLAPWTLVFIFANAFMEELHFRGLLLKPFEDLLGSHLANLCIASFFTLIHAPVEYTQDIFIFLSVLFVLALAWGYLIQKTQSLWGSVLFHAGADLMIIIGIYEAYGAN